ncbi:ribonuclease HIII [Hydrogenobacter sp. T-2]|uniref:ribonuclease HIII n=1 Tax=Pampinifervens diazotrophicum TaxID=1632018 RepID=UPI002B258AC3|nr:ribonuclease HIII [Hydrogenobacter sp. T-2]WPM31703.1 ribonuclease HIII [Hydrogenobacter sp. T-2]
MSNLTLRLEKEDWDRVRALLEELGFKGLPRDCVVWYLTDGSNHATLYSSGTLLIQGKRAKEVKDLILSSLGTPEEVLIGCDESGKGDVFGPLVLCCAVIKPEYYRRVLSLNMKDCKRLSDEAVLKKASDFRSFGEYKCRLVEPKELNELYERKKNLNRILDELYVGLLEEFLKRYPEGRFSVDAYSSKSPFDGRVSFIHKGEEDLAVATASVLARAGFLRWLENRGLPKGSSKEAMALARRIYREDKERAKESLKLFFL